MKSTVFIGDIYLPKGISQATTYTLSFGDEDENSDIVATRTSEHGQYQIDLFDADVLGQDGFLADGEPIIITFRNGKCSTAIIQTYHNDRNIYIHDVTL